MLLHQRIDEAGGRHVKGLGVLRLTARTTDDDDVRLRAERGAHHQSATRNQQAPFHASPHRRRSSHSAAIKPNNAMNIAGVSHRSSCSVIVVPLLVYITSRASASAVSGV